MTSVDDTFLDGPIGPDVVEVADKHDSHWLQLIDRTWRFADDETASPVSLQDLVTFGAPLTVTAVREQPADVVPPEYFEEPVRVIEAPAQPTCPAHGAHPHWNGATCLDCPICRPPYRKPAAPEPQQADASPVLDLVRQYGEESYQQGIAAGQRDEGSEDHYDDKARALFARISALVPQQPVQARDYYGVPLWIHGCGHVARSQGETRSVRCDCFNPEGTWLPLLVGGDPAPEPLESRAAYWERRFNEEARSHDEDALSILTLHRERDEARAELERVYAEPAEAVTDRESARGALRRVAAERDEARTRMLEHLGEADEARAEVERLSASATSFKGDKGEIHVTAVIDGDGRPRLYVQWPPGAHETPAPENGAVSEIDRLQSEVRDLKAELAAADQMLGVVTAADPLVLSLPEVPEGTGSVVGSNGWRWLPRDGGWWNGAGGATWRLVDLLATHGPLTVELVPPREPRTWPKLDGPPKDLPSVRGASGIVYRRWADNSAYYFPPPGPQRRAVFGDAKLLSHWREVDGPLTEVTE